LWSNSLLKVLDLGLIPYRQAWELQTRRRDAVSKGLDDEVVFLAEHPPTITLGRSTKASDLALNADQFKEVGIEVVKVDRGGRATFHGPGQIVAYPLIDLSRRKKDLRAYVASLEDAGTAAVRRFGIDARAGRDPIGVFVGNLKIASLGVAVRRWTTMHGIALNVSNSMEAYQYFNPCGLPGSIMTRLNDFADAAVDQVKKILVDELLNVLV